MIKFFESGIRGGLSFACDRLIEVADLPNMEIGHWDMNNLYGQAQGDYLPISNYEWHKNPQRFMNPKVWENFRGDVSTFFYSFHNNVVHKN